MSVSLWNLRLRKVDHVQSFSTQDARLGIGQAIRRHLAIVLAALVLVPAAAAALVLTQAPSYTSSATVFLRPTTGNALSPDSAKNAQQVTVAMETEAGMVSSPEVAALVGRKLGRTVEAGSADVRATVPPNTQIVQIQYTDSSADEARAGAQAYADSFLADREAVSTRTIKGQLDLLKTQATGVSANLKEVSRDAASARPAPDSAALVQLYTNRLSNLQDLIGQLEATDTNPGSIVTPATTPARSGGLSPVLVLFAAAVMALLIGVTLAVWRERVDDSIRVAEVEAVAGAPFLARLPSVNAADGEGQRRQQVELANAYRQARASTLVAIPQPAVVAVAAADSSSYAPVGMIAANLALSLTNARYRVCVIDLAGAGRTSAAEALNVADDRDAVPLLTGDPAAVDRLPVARGVTFVGRDRLPEEGDGLFVSARFGELVSRLRAEHDMVLIASPPAGSAHSTEISLAADGMILVLTDRRSTHRSVAETVSQQARLRAPVLGLLSVEPRPRHGAGRTENVYDVTRTPTMPETSGVGSWLQGSERAAARPAAAEAPAAAATPAETPAPPATPATPTTPTPATPTPATPAPPLSPTVLTPQPGRSPAPWNTPLITPSDLRVQPAPALETAPIPQVPQPATRADGRPAAARGTGGATSASDARDDDAGNPPATDSHGHDEQADGGEPDEDRGTDRRSTLQPSGHRPENAG